MGADVNIAKAKFVWAKIRKMQVMDIKRSQLFQNCRGKYFSKTEELFPILELLEEYGYLKITQPEYNGTGRPPDVHLLINTISFWMKTRSGKSAAITESFWSC